MSATEPARSVQAVADEVGRTLADVDPVAFDRLVAELRVPERTWFCTGRGRSGLVARMAAMRLMHLGLPTAVVGDATAPAITGADVLLVLSASGTTPLSLHFARTAVEVAAVVVLVTATPLSPIGHLAGATLELPVPPSTQFGGSLFEQTSLLVLDAAVLALVPGDPQAHAVMQSRHANLQ